jgi:hypothetical protein
MTENGGTPGADVVYEFVTILVVKSRPVSAPYEKRVPVDCFEGSNRAIDAPGEVPQCFVEEFCGSVGD